LSQVPDTSFFAILHSKARKDSNNIYGLELVRIVHTESSSLLSADICYKHKKPEIYLSSYVGSNETENIGGNCIWEIENSQVEEIGFQIKLNRFDHEEMTRFSSPTILRHVVSHLRVNTLKKKVETVTNFTGEKDIPVLDIDEEEDMHREGAKQTFFHFYPSVKLQETFNKNSTYLIKNDMGMYLKATKGSYSKNKLVSVFMKDTEEKRDYLNPLDESSSNVVKTPTAFSDIQSSKDTFLIKKVSNQEANYVHFIRSCIPLLNSISTNFRRPKEESRPYPSNDRYLKLIKMLKKISDFIYDMEQSVDHLSDDIEGTPNQLKQKLIKDFGIIDLLVDIIYLPIKNEFYKLSDLMPTLSFTSVITSCYNTMRRTFQGNYANELYTSQWLSIFMHHSLNTKKENDIQAVKTIQELIGKNLTILETCINQDIIKNFIANLKSSSQREVKYILILRALCIYDNQPIAENQKMLSRLVLLDPEARHSILIPIKYDQDGTLMIFEKNKWESVASLNMDPDQVDLYKYFVSMIDLLRDILFEKNQLGRDVVEELYPMHLCQAILMDDSVSYEVRGAFCRLMMSLWIFRHPFFVIAIPYKMKMYDDFRDELVFGTQDSNILIFNRLKTFIVEFIVERLEGKRGTYGREENLPDFMFILLDMVL
jgi:hypothetical protein